MSSVESVSDVPAAHESTALSTEDLHQLLYLMRLTRAVEDRVRSLYLQGRIPGAVYSSRGQEGTAVASAYALGPGDYVAPLIRDLGATLTRGVEPGQIFAQWLGRTGGLTEGRDGNLHFGDLVHGILAPISMLGATIPLCAGVGLATKQRGGDRVALAYIGDGGTNTGDFHEGLNFAAALCLPLVLIVEDNGFAYSTPSGSHVAIASFAERAVAYGIPGVTIDGNDVIAVYRHTREAVDRARRGEGPTLIEVKTFRMRGHAEHDDAFYVPQEMHEYWETRDPITLLLRYLEARHLIDNEVSGRIDSRVAAVIAEGLDWAEASPPPDPATQISGVYADS